VVAPIAHGHADRPMYFGAAQRGNERGDKSMVIPDTKQCDVVDPSEDVKVEVTFPYPNKLDSALEAISNTGRFQEERTVPHTL